jgi:hypothetical protein
MNFDYSLITNQIAVTRDNVDAVLYNGYHSLYMVLGTMEGIDEEWPTMSFAQRCLFTSCVGIALGVNPDEVPKTGVIFGYFTSFNEERADWLVEVVDPRDNCHIYVDWYNELHKSNIMKNPNDITGLYHFLCLIGEMFEEDTLVDIKDPKFISRAP